MMERPNEELVDVIHGQTTDLSAYGEDGRAEVISANALSTGLVGRYNDEQSALQPPLSAGTTEHRLGLVDTLSYGLKSPTASRTPAKTLNRDLSGIEDAEIFSRKSELEHMTEIRANAKDPLLCKYVKKGRGLFDDSILQHYEEQAKNNNNIEQIDYQNQQHAYKRGRKPSVLDEEGGAFSMGEGSKPPDKDLVRKTLGPTEATL